MKWTISTAIDSTIANSFLSRMHKSMGNLIIIIEKERLIREWSSQEKPEGSGKLGSGHDDGTSLKYDRKRTMLLSKLL